MSWLYLSLAILFELAGTTAMKFSAGLTRPVPILFMGLFYGVSFLTLALALRYIDVSVAYAIWSGIGTAAVALIGFIWFKESINRLKIASIALIIVGVLGLELARVTEL
jgi:small multidrug resistance pump